MLLYSFGKEFLLVIKVSEIIESMDKCFGVKFAVKFCSETGFFRNSQKISLPAHQCRNFAIFTN